MSIIFDADGIAAALHEPWIDWHNKRINKKATPLKIEDIKTYGMLEYSQLDPKEQIYDFLDIPGVYRTLKPLPGAVDTVKRLNEKHEFVFVTAGAKEPETAGDKLWWIEKHFGLPRQQVFIGHKKHMVKADFFLDDSPEKLERYSAAWPNARTMTISYPYNRGIPVSFRADGYQDTAQAFDQIMGYIERVSGIKA